MIIGSICFIIIFFVGFALFKKKPNTYISVHQKKWKQEKEYEDYIKWLDKNGGDLPIKEFKFKEDKEVMNKVFDNFK